jgi:phytoene desaturase
LTHPALPMLHGMSFFLSQNTLIASDLRITGIFLAPTKLKQPKSWFFVSTSFCILLTKTRNLKVAIIGAGVAGLASAVRMACRGHEVDVYEANDYPGGKLSQFELNGYRFDAGPSLFTMPQYVEDLFKLAGEEIEPHFSYLRLPVVCHYFWEDGTYLEAHAEADRFAEEANKVLGVPPEQVKAILQNGQLKYELTGRIFLEKSLHKLSTWMHKDVLKALGRLPKLHLFGNMNSVHKKYFDHPKMVQLFNRFATYNGSNPYKAPGLLSMIPYFEHEIGAFYPKEGMFSITNSIYELAKRKGVNFHFETKVDEILSQGKEVKGVRIGDHCQEYDRVISNMDIFYTYHHLLPKHKKPKRILRQQKSTSALIFYWGVKKTFDNLNLHNILFSDNYKEEFSLLEAGKISDDPTVYINISQKYTPEDAPEGCENWFTMINVPFDSGQDWDELIKRARENIIKKTDRILGVDMESLIECEAILDPRTIERKTSSHLGALYGTSSNNRMAAFMRHANFSNQIKGLYFCGGSVHPGGGIPLCMMSAKIVDELMH